MPDGWKEFQRAQMLEEIKRQRAATAERRADARRNFDAKGLARADEDDAGLDIMQRRVMSEEFGQ